MRKVIIYQLLACLLLFLSCNKWLTIDPETEVDAERNFRTEAGFNMAMNGIYVGMSSRAMHGGQLSYGVIDAMARNYDVTGGSDLIAAASNYEYNDPSLKPTIAGFWDKSYHLIANCNEILEQVELKSDDLFTISTKSTFKGEALAARAVLHFDLVRMFAPAPVYGDSEIVKYYEGIVNIGKLPTKTSVILKNVIKDLQLAKELFRVYDTSAAGKIRFKQLTQRFGMAGNKGPGYRFNYYSVTALIARVALYAGEVSIAAEAANEIILSKQAVFTTANNVNQNKFNKLFSDDLLQTFYCKELDDNALLVINDAVSIKNYDDIFPVSINDFRKKLYVANSSANYKTIKYQKTENTLLNAQAQYMIPMIRLSEMHYILAEIQAETDVIAANKTLLALVKARGITAAVNNGTKEEVINYIIADARREFMCEGQLFFLYKRLNMPVRDELAGGSVTLTLEQTYFPVPDSEN